MLLILSLITFALATPNPTWSELYQTANWVQKSSLSTDIGTVVVYTKKVDNFPCFRGDTVADILPSSENLSTMVTIAGDAASALDWSSADLTEGVELGRTDTYIDYYQYLSIPLLSDRYWFLRGYPERDGPSYLFRWEKLIEGGPYTEFYKEVQHKYPNEEETLINIGAWIFTPKETQTHIQYIICSHPGGSVPTMLQSVATEDSLPTNIQDMIQETHRRK